MLNHKGTKELATERLILRKFKIEDNVLLKKSGEVYTQVCYSTKRRDKL